MILPPIVIPLSAAILKVLRLLKISVENGFSAELFAETEAIEAHNNLLILLN